MSEVVLSVEKIKKTFRYVPHFIEAVKEVSFEVRQGEVVALLGLNGAGKTTSVKMILNFLSPDQGQISIFGVDSRNPKARERLSYLPEKIELPPELKPSELFRFLGVTFSIPKAETDSRQEELLNLVKLSQRKDSPLGKFSKGMLQRLGLALTLFHRPEFVILDEPLTGLDPLGQKMVEDIIAEQKKQGLTMLICSHNLDFVERVCDRVVVVHQGRVLDDFKVSELSVPLRNHFFQLIGVD